MPRPICVKCEIEMRPKKNGVTVEEFTEEGLSYKLWMGDLWECPICQASVIVGFGARSLAEHWHTDYATARAAEAERGRIYSCRPLREAKKEN